MDNNPYRVVFQSLPFDEAIEFSIKYAKKKVSDLVDNRVACAIMQNQLSCLEVKHVLDESFREFMTFGETAIHVSEKGVVSMVQSY